MASKIGQKKEESGRPQSRVGSAIADRALTSQTVAAVTTPPIPVSLQAGKYVRWTITLLPERLERVKAIAAALSAEVSDERGEPVEVPVLTLARWLVEQGIAAYERGERPPFETQLRIK